MSKPAFTQKWLFQKLFLRSLNNWFWIVLSVLTAFTIAFLINRYQSKVYRTSLQVIKGQVERTGAQEVAHMFGGGRESSSINLQFERAFITSLPVIEAVVRDLELHIVYYSRGRVKSAERYGATPVKVHPDPASARVPHGIMITVVPKKAHHYGLETENPEWQALFANKPFDF